MKKLTSQMRILIRRLFNWSNKHRCTRLVDGSRELNFHSLKPCVLSYFSKTLQCPARWYRCNKRKLKGGGGWSGEGNGMGTLDPEFYG